MYAKLPKQNVDISSVCNKIGKILVIIPSESKNVLLIQIAFNIVYVILGLALLADGIITYEENPFYKLYLTSVGLCLGSANGNFLYGMIAHRKSWHNMIENINSVVSSNGLTFKSKLKLISYTFTLIILSVLVICVNKNFNAPLFLNVISSILIITLVFIDILVVENTIVLRDRTMNIINLLNMLDVNGIRKQQVSTFIVYAMSTYKKIFSAVENFNEFFGMIMLLRIILNTFVILVCFVYILNWYYDKNGLGLYALCFFLCGIIQLGFVIYCIISCENVQKAGEKLLTLCTILQYQVQDPLLKEKLMDLSTLIAALPLIFSISGFVTLNKRVIPGLISGISSYLIILIQFKTQN